MYRTDQLLRQALIGAGALLTLGLAGCGAASAGLPASTPVVANVALDPNAVTPPITRTNPKRVHVHLEAKEVVGELAPGKRFLFWAYSLVTPKGTSRPTVPGPMIRVMAGDTLVVELTNAAGDRGPHGLDFHAAIGPGGGTDMEEVQPGQTRTFVFKALRPGAYAYHCGAEGKPWEHVSHGMYGLIEVDPRGGLPRGYRELYIGQNEWYLDSGGHLDRAGVTFYNLDDDKARADAPRYVTFDGNVAALTSPKLFGSSMQVRPGQKVRIFFVNGGPNLVSNFHVIGEIFDRAYPAGRGAAEKNAETVMVPPGSATVFEFTAGSPGMYPFVDHSLWQAEEGAMGVLSVIPGAMGH